MQDTAVKKNNCGAGCCSWNHYFLTLLKAGWQMLLAGAGSPQQMPAGPCWLTAAGAAHQFTLGGAREGDPSSRATHSRQTERNLKHRASEPAVSKGRSPGSPSWAGIYSLTCSVCPRLAKHVRSEKAGARGCVARSADISQSSQLKDCFGNWK